MVYSGHLHANPLLEFKATYYLVNRIAERYIHQRESDKELAFITKRFIAGYNVEKDQLALTPLDDWEKETLGFRVYLVFHVENCPTSNPYYDKQFYLDSARFRHAKHFTDLKAAYSYFWHARYRPGS